MSFNIKEMSLKTPARKHHWVCRLIQHKKSLLNLKAERYALREDIVQAIQRESPVKVTRPIAEKKFIPAREDDRIATSY